MDIEYIASQIVDAAILVHKALGPGLLESAYQKCLVYELTARGILVQTEIPLPVIYRDVQIDVGYCIDMMIDDCVVIENKAVEQIMPIHEAQLITYLKLSGHTIGFLLNWNVVKMKDGIKRMVNHPTSQPLNYLQKS
jgi:GxxExxY protein